MQARSRMRVDPGAAEELLREPEPAAATDDDRLVAAVGQSRLLADAPVANADDPIRHSRRLGIVADEHRGRPRSAGQLGDRLVDEARVRGVELPVGSSARSSRGRWASAAQIATRCCSPPESSRGCASARSSSPTRSSSSPARPRRSMLRARPRGRAGGRRALAPRAPARARASSAGRHSRAPRSDSPPCRDGPAAPDLARGRARCRRSAASSAASSRRSVDFPEPLGPRTTQISPSRISSVRPWSATTPPSGAG